MYLHELLVRIKMGLEKYGEGFVLDEGYSDLYKQINELEYLEDIRQDFVYFLDRAMEKLEVSEENEIVHAASAEHYYPYVEINQARINFTILTEIAVAGENNNPKYKKRIDYYLQKLKSNKKMLLKSGVALNRKIMIWLACTNYGIYSKLIYRLTRK